MDDLGYGTRDQGLQRHIRETYLFIPDWFKQELDRLRGSSIYGDPILRVVFGADERDHNGKLKYIDPIDNGPMNCWILERWQPAGFFGSRQSWEDSDRFYDDVRDRWVNLKGPYPDRGAYTMVCPLIGDDGKFVPLDETVMRGIKKKIADDEMFAGMQAFQRNEAIVAKQQAEDDWRQSEADKRQDFIREHHLKNWDKENRSTTRAYSTHPR